MNKIKTLIPLSDFVTETYKELLVRSGDKYKDNLELYAKLTKRYADLLSETNYKLKLLLEGFTNNDNFKKHKSRDYDYWLIKLPYNNYSQSHTPEQYEKELLGTHVMIGGRIEHLCYYGLTLKEQALKQIYG